MKQRARILLPAAVLSVGAGCASKDWVERELNRRDARLEQTLSAQVQQSTDPAQQRLNAVDQRVQTLEDQNAQLQGRSVALEARSSQLEARSAALEDRSSQLEGRVQDSSARAADAGARAEGVDARLTHLWTTRNVRTVVNVLQVEFRFDQSTLDDAAKSLLVALTRELRENPELAVDLEGYTDTTGSYQYNVRLSQRRVDAVWNYLVEQGVERHRIRAAARGPADDVAVSDSRRRRVDIKLVVTAD